MLKAKVAVFVSGGGTNLQALLDASKAGQMPHADLALVISSAEGVFALERAEKAGVAHAVVSRKACTSQDDFEGKICALLAEHGIDMIVLAGFMSILSADFVKKYPERILNVHPSLIPSFCGQGFYGLRVHQAALDYGVKVTGATVHFVNEVPDGGRILLQKAVDILPNDTAKTLQLRVMEQAEWLLLPQATESVAQTLV